jgi:hypothetical protein
MVVRRGMGDLGVLDSWDRTFPGVPSVAARTRMQC